MDDETLADIHSGLLVEERRRLGISDELIRFSVGIEATKDIFTRLKDHEK